MLGGVWGSGQPSDKGITRIGPGLGHCLARALVLLRMHSSLAITL